ncbi:MAG: hypothetical protein ABFE08_17755 [Armatimonadia bacterium]
MTVVLANNVATTLALDLSAGAGSMRVAGGTGSRFPAIAAGQYYYATLIAPDKRLEVVKVTARSGDLLTVTRAQEGTQAAEFFTGSKVELRITAQSVEDAIEDGLSQVRIHVGTAPPENPTLNMLWIDTR